MGISSGSAEGAALQRIERALRESEARFRRLADNAHDYIYRYELQPSGHFSYCSPAVTRMFGFTPEEFYADPELPLKIVVPEDREQSAWLQTGQHVAEQATIRVRRKDGRLVWAEFRRVPIYDERGTLLAVEAIVRDVTERRRAEESQRFLALAGELLAGTLDERTTLTNLARLVVPALADWCTVDVVRPDGSTIGLGGSHIDPALEGVIRELQRRYPPDRHGIQPISEVLRSGRSVLLETVSDADLAASSPDAEQMQLRRRLGFRSAMYVPLRARNRLVGIITLVSANAERRYGPDDLALPEELARRAALAVENARLYREAQEAIQKRDDFLSIAAHELKTPITSLRGFAQLLMRRLDRERHLAPEQLRHALGTIELQSGKLAHLIAQLLDLTRIDAGRLSLARMPTDLVDLLQRSVEAVQMTTSRHTFTLTAPAAAPAAVDAMRLEQVLTNLFDNAVKYSPAGGPVDVTLELGPSTVTIGVADRGVGVDMAQRQRIFDRFYQAQGDRAGGMGLGLYISRQIAELHGGRLEVEARPGGGSRFLLTLPRGAAG